MAKIKTPKTVEDMPLAIITNMVTLATSGFGVVVALAWNEAIKQTVATYIDPLLGKGSGIVSLFIYAVIMTLLAVLVTMQLAQLQKRFEHVSENLKNKK